MQTSINNSNSIQRKETPKKHPRKNIATTGAIMLSLLWAPKATEAKTDITNTTNTELAVTIDQKPIIFDWDEHQNKLRSKEEMTIDFIKNNVYINWKSINDIDGAKVTKKNDKLYSVEFEYNFSELEWSKKIKLEFNTKYENNSISFNFDNSQIFINNKRVLLKTNTSVEINDITHNNYDIRTIWNWKRENFNIVYNDIKTKKAIEENIKNGKSVLLEIELQGAITVMKKCPEALSIFIKPPSFEELERRLRGRCSESEEAIQKRLASIQLELENSKKFDYKIINDTVDNAVKSLEEIICQ